MARSKLARAARRTRAAEPARRTPPARASKPGRRKSEIALAIHGGAWNIPDRDVEAHRRGMDRALREAWDRLRDGATALDAVEYAVRLLEDDVTFNAGRGGHLNRGGRLELDASMMDGRTLRAGAVAAIEAVRHPVSVARAVLERSPHVLLTGRGAR